jgi:hypothetical protein
VSITILVIPIVAGALGELEVLLPPEQATKPIEMEPTRTNLLTQDKDAALRILPPQDCYFDHSFKSSKSHINHLKSRKRRAKGNRYLRFSLRNPKM